MLRTFPKAYPDEFLYSIFARYHIRSGNKNFSQTIRDLVGYVPHQHYGLALPSNLNFLVKSLGLISNQTVENLLLNHTLYPFYQLFLTQPEAFLLKDYMRNKAGKPIFQIAKIPIGESGESKQLLRFCSRCFEEDFQRYGEAYWHRMHQIPGILICLVHEIVLSESLVNHQEGYLDCHAADVKNCPVNVDTGSYSGDTTQNLWAIAQEIDWLMNSSFRFKGLQWLRRRYQEYLVQRGFLKILSSGNYKFHEKDFADAVLSFYDQNCLSLIKPGLVSHASGYFYRCLFACDVEPTIDRATHILLIIFLSKTLKNFFEQ